jgi:uncharacterized protein YbjT (DUF2867 family)
MKILLTGATGYIGKRLLPHLLELGHHVVCLVRDKNRFSPPTSLREKISIIEGDLLDLSSLSDIPSDIDAAYYLVHSMNYHDNYFELESQCAINFRNQLKQTKVKHLIYLGGIINEQVLSEHLNSRKNVETELSKGDYHLTCLRAGIIIGSGSASFEIMRDLIEKLPIMITPKWLTTRCQPIGISDVILILVRTLFHEKTYNQDFDIGCEDVLTYKEMLLGLARIRNLARFIFTIPIMTPRLSSYWLYFVTSTSYRLARSLVDSMKIEVVCRPSKLNEWLNIKPLSYEGSIKKAFARIESNEIISSWKDSYSSSGSIFNISDFIEVPNYGCFRDHRSQTMVQRDKTIQSIWSIGGENGWYYATWLWKLRGFLDKVFGGVGLRRGRRNQRDLSVGDALDFWRVLYADPAEGRLLLFAEMKLPGEAWLEFKVVGDKLQQTATFRPLGVAGRLYWYSVLPLHGYIFTGLLNKLAKST